MINNISSGGVVYICHLQKVSQKGLLNDQIQSLKWLKKSEKFITQYPELQSDFFKLLPLCNHQLKPEDFFFFFFINYKDITCRSRNQQMFEMFA